MIHTGERPFKCEQPGCEAAFTQRQSLKSHCRAVHKQKLPPGPKPEPKKNKKKENSEDLAVNEDMSKNIIGGNLENDTTQVGKMFIHAIKIVIILK